MVFTLQNTALALRNKKTIFCLDKLRNLGQGTKLCFQGVTTRKTGFIFLTKEDRKAPKEANIPMAKCAP